jgi:hypothetical protein
MIRTSQKNQKADIRTRFKNKPIQRIKLSLFNPGSVSREGEKRITSSLLLKYVIIKPRTCQLNYFTGLSYSEFSISSSRHYQLINFLFYYMIKKIHRNYFFNIKEQKPWQAGKMHFPSCPSMN